MIKINFYTNIKNILLVFCVVLSTIFPNSNAWACWTCADVPILTTIQTTLSALLVSVRGTSVQSTNDLLGVIAQQLRNNGQTSSETSKNISTSFGQKLVAAHSMSQNESRFPSQAQCESVSANMNTIADLSKSAGVLNMSELESLAERQTTNVGNESIGENLSKLRYGFCSDEMYNNPKFKKNNFCQNKSEMPGATLSAGSIFYGAKRQTNSADGKNQSFTADQYDAAKLFMGNVLTPEKPAMISPTTDLSTVAAKRALQYWSTWTSRSTVAENAFRRIIATKTAQSTNKDFNDKFATVKTEAIDKDAWDNVFMHSSEFPGAKMSEWDNLKYQVFSKNTVESMSSIATDNPSEVAKQSALMQALQLRLTWMQLERQEDQNALLAALLSHQLDPVVRTQVTNMQASQ